MDLPPAKEDISFLIFLERHLGQDTSASVSVDLKRNSNSWRHLLHLNSYIGIIHITFFGSNLWHEFIKVKNLRMIQMHAGLQNRLTYLY